MRVLSGMQPSGTLHIGNTSCSEAVGRGAEPDAFYCVVDLHALTLEIEPATLRSQSFDLIARTWRRTRPDVCTIFLQSEVRTTPDELDSRMRRHLRRTQSYDAVQGEGVAQDGYRVGLLTYPVLMAGTSCSTRRPRSRSATTSASTSSDASDRGALQHRYGPTSCAGRRAAEGRGARDGLTRAHAKDVQVDLEPMGSIFVTDSAMRSTRRSRRRSPTRRRGSLRLEKKPASHLLEIYSSFSNDTPQAVAERYTRYGDLKKDLAALIIESLEPIHKRYDELLADPVELRAVVARGAVKASAVAGEVYRRAAQAIGLI